jgi:hypothetical protein
MLVNGSYLEFVLKYGGFAGGDYTYFPIEPYEGIHDGMMGIFFGINHPRVQFGLLVVGRAGQGLCLLLGHESRFRGRPARYVKFALDRQVV